MSGSDVFIFRRRMWWQSLLYRCWAPYRRRCDAASMTAIRRLIDDPALPCMIEGHYIPGL